MSNIVAGLFDDFAHAEAAMRGLRSQGGVDPTAIAHVVVGAPGRNAGFAIGGDQDKDEGSARADGGALAGAAIGCAAGAVAGAAATAMAGPIAAAVGTAVGAYAGSLAGALDKMEDTSLRGASPPRPAGVMVMVRVSTSEQREIAIRVLGRNAARGIEEADGEWRDGTWADFDPVSPARWIVPPAAMASGQIGA